MLRPLLLCLLINLTACTTLQASKSSTNKHFERSLTRLEKEHNNRTILIVNIRPVKKRNCWAHNRHWHCHR